MELLKLIVFFLKIGIFNFLPVNKKVLNSNDFSYKGKYIYKYEVVVMKFIYTFHVFEREIKFYFVQ